MKRLLILTAIVLSISACSDSDKTAAAMKTFIESCKTPVSGRLAVSSGWSGNTIELKCPEFKGTPTQGE